MNISKFLARLPFLKRGVPAIKKAYARLFWPRGFTLGWSKGALFLLNYRNFIDRQIAFFGDFEDEQFDYLAQEMRRRQCDVFLDVGANIGYYAILVGVHRLARRVIAFEPDQRNLHQLAANIVLNGLTDRIETVAKAVSNRSGTISFLPQPDSSTGQSRVGEGDGACQVEAVALDDFIDLANQCVCMKIDVEGHELEAIRGMGRTLRSNRVVLQIECFAAHIAALQAQMDAAGFRLIRQIRDDYFFANF